MRYGTSSAGTRARSAPIPRAASAMPSGAETAPSTTLSVSSWRTIRPRPAPIAARTDISRARAVARASSRLATLAQAMSSTKVTAPERGQGRPASLRRHEVVAQRPDVRSPSPALGSVAASRVVTAPRSSRACSIVTPSRAGRTARDGARLAAPRARAVQARRMPPAGTESSHRAGARRRRCGAGR